MNAPKVVVAVAAGLVAAVVVWLLPGAGAFSLILSAIVGVGIGLVVAFAMGQGSFGEPRIMPVVPGDFFLQRMGREEGPVPYTTLVTRARTGSLTGDTMVRTPESDWFPAREMSPAIFSKRTWIATLLLSVFAGGFGIDRFYLGKVPSGILKLVTLGGLGLWSLIDVILIATNRMTDRDGLPLAR
ncbi:NINE protein [Nocardioides pelophilus]|uniref:NINE protein n=1 Tax=Nocardioides pelophilus TaxID=2172019 RepID=UPI001C7F9DB4|nr:NINE protein [Nocardioides pelophilus]